MKIPCSKLLKNHSLLPFKSPMVEESQGIRES